MQFNVPNVFRAPEMARIESEIVQFDPAALVDYDARRMALRLSTSLEPAELASALTRAGLPVSAADLQCLPSECCGGCGG
jgi:hypothetical protein